MFSVKWVRQLLVFALCGFAGVASAQEEGWYAVAFGGQSKVRGVSQTEIDNAVIDAFESAGFSVVDADSSLDDTDTGFGAGLGYRVNDNFAAELAYADLGAIKYRASGTVTDGVSNLAASLDGKVTAKGPVLSFLGILPISERFALYGRAGIALMDAKASVSATIDGVSDSISDSTQRSNVMFGVGGEFYASERFGIRVEWNRYSSVGSKELTDNQDVDVISLGLRIGFNMP